MSLTGSGPDDVQRVGVPIADLLAGMYGAFGVLAALQERERTGRGQVVRTSLLAAVVGVHAFQGTKWTVAGEVGEAQGNHHPSICPYGLFHTADGAVQIAVGSEGLWKRFCDGLRPRPRDAGNGDEPAAGRQRQAGPATGRGRVRAVLHRRAARRSSTESACPPGESATIREVYEWEQTKSQGLLIDVDHATLGTITLPGPPLRFFDAGRHRASPVASTPLRRCSAPTTTSSRRRCRRITDDTADRARDASTPSSTRDSWTVLGRGTSRSWRDDARVRRRTGLRASENRARRVGPHRRGHRSAGAAWRCWCASSASSAARSASPRASG